VSEDYGPSLVAMRNELRFVILFDLIQRSVTTEVDGTHAERMHHGHYLRGG